MASEKRAASENYSQMVVKRPNLGNNSKALATVNGSSANGALVQAVSFVFYVQSLDVTLNCDKNGRLIRAM